MPSPLRKPRIAFVTTMAGTAWGGSEELWLGTARRMIADGCSVSASVFKWPEIPPRVAELQADGAEVHFRPRGKNPVARLLDKRFQKRSGLAITPDDVKWLRSFAPDLVLISQGYPLDGLKWMNACRKLGIRYATLVHAGGELWWPEDSTLDQMRGDYEGAKAVYFVSQANRKIVQYQLGLELSNASVVLNPWNVDSDTAVEWPEDDGTLHLACVGRMDPRAKGQDVILRMMAMPKWRERPVHVHFYGSGPCSGSIRRLAEMLGVSAVTFHGQVPDVRAIWRRCHALLLPSRYEGLPLVIVEAMLCARIAITTDVAGNAEYINDGVNGFVAAAPTPPLLDEAMERAWTHRGDWSRMGTQARADLKAVLPTDVFGVFRDLVLNAASPD